jgi:hypothetical protein
MCYAGFSRDHAYAAPFFSLILRLLKLPSVAMLIEKLVKHLTHLFNRKVALNMKGPVLTVVTATC